MVSIVSSNSDSNVNRAESRENARPESVDSLGERSYGSFVAELGIADYLRTLQKGALTNTTAMT